MYIQLAKESFEYKEVSRHPKKRPCKQKRLRIWTAKRKEKDLKTVTLLNLIF